MGCLRLGLACEVEQVHGAADERLQVAADRVVAHHLATRARTCSSELHGAGSGELEHATSAQKEYEAAESSSADDEGSWRANSSSQSDESSSATATELDSRCSGSSPGMLE